MMIRSSALARSGRALLAFLALVANFVATGMPMLHAWAHEVADSHHAHAGEVESIDHTHDEVHPAVLHADCLVVHRVAFDLAVALPTQSLELQTYVVEAAVAFRPVAPVLSRAPPSLSQARAPPLV